MHGVQVEDAVFQFQAAGSVKDTTGFGMLAITN
jgi:hypothetical protein